MYSDFMTTHILFSEDIRILNGTRAYNEESSSNILFAEEIEEFP